MTVAAGATKIRTAPRWQLVGRAGAALTLLVFLWQSPFFVWSDLPRVGTYLVQQGFVVAWMLLVTSFTRTVPLRTLATYWFVGVFPVMAFALLVDRPLEAMLDGGKLVSAYLGPLVEDLIKPLPVLAFFAYRARRGGWQLSPTDGLLLGLVVGAGFAFHEDAGYGRVWGGGFGDTSWSVLFPTVGEFRGDVLPGHDVMTALVGLAIGFAFFYRRYKFAWVLPVVTWLVVLIEHVTGNLADLAGNLPRPAEVIRMLILGGQGVAALLVGGIVAAVILEWRVLRSITERDPLFPPIRFEKFTDTFKERTRASLRRIQAMLAYVHQRRSVYYSVWAARDLAPVTLQEMASTLFGLGREAGVSVEETFEEYDRIEQPAPTEAPSASPPEPAAPNPAPG
jgi:RsiW-degrading membrane proteinase PrsW (M82 family)